MNDSPLQTPPPPTSTPQHPPSMSPDTPQLAPLPCGCDSSTGSVWCGQLRYQVCIQPVLNSMAAVSMTNRPCGTRAAAGNRKERRRWCWLVKAGCWSESVARASLDNTADNTQAFTPAGDLQVALLQSKPSLVCRRHLHSAYRKLKGKQWTPPSPSPALFCSLCVVIRKDDHLDADGGGLVGKWTCTWKWHRSSSLAEPLYFLTRLIILLLRGGASC